MDAETRTNSKSMINSMTMITIMNINMTMNTIIRMSITTMNTIIRMSMIMGTGISTIMNMTVMRIPITMSMRRRR